MAITEIGTLSFNTKKSAKAYFRNIRDSYQDDEQLNSRDTEHLHMLIVHHPESDQKIGCGISHFTVTTETVFRKTRHFVLHRNDGTSTDFSFISCIDGRSLRGDKLEALRRQVEEQIIRFRDELFSRGKVYCPYLRVELSLNSCHIDHAPPNTFMKIVEDWLESEGIDLLDIQITPPKDYQHVTHMTDLQQKEGWSSYHLANANLRILSPIANLSHAKLEK